MCEIIKFQVSKDYQPVHIMSAPTILHHMQNSWIVQLDPQIPVRSMDSCAKYGSIDCAVQSISL